MACGCEDGMLSCKNHYVEFCPLDDVIIVTLGSEEQAGVTLLFKLWSMMELMSPTFFVSCKTFLEKNIRF